jgi:GAF domain-containing protein
MRSDHATIRARVDRILEAPSPRDAKLKAICYLLRRKVPHFHWVGFYLVDPDSPRELVLGPYEGDPTEHVRIPFGSGICGQVAESEETMIVQDVAAESNYLSCSIDVRSEIVVPILADGRFVAQLDIDSHDVSPFTDADRDLLESICTALSRTF